MVFLLHGVTSSKFQSLQSHASPSFAGKSVIKTTESHAYLQFLQFLFFVL